MMLDQLYDVSNSSYVSSAATPTVIRGAEGGDQCATNAIMVWIRWDGESVPFVRHTAFGAA